MLVIVAVPQLSVAVGAFQFTTALQEEVLVPTVMFEGQPEKTGLVLSVTVMVNEHVSVLPLPSLAVYVMVCTPTANNEPGSGSVLVTVGVPQLSVAVGAVQLTTAPQEEGSVGNEILEGHPTKTGFILSTT